MSKIRVLHVVTIMNLGGIETFLMTLYRNIDREKVQFDFLVHREEEGFFDKEIKELGGEIKKISPLNPFKYTTYKKELYRILENTEYNIIHSHLNANSSIILSIAKKCNIPCRIAHSHIDKSGNGLKGLMKSVLKQTINKVSTHKFACSSQAGDWLFGVNEDFIVFNNAIKSDNFIFNQNLRSNIRYDLGIDDDTIVLGNIARFNEQKNHTFMIKVFKEFQLKYSNSRLLLLGEGELLEKIKNEVSVNELNEKVIFTGAVSNANEYLNAMDLFLFPSLFEGLGIVAVEAQCNGLPVIMNETLPKEVEITSLVERVSLNSSIDKWVDILSISYNNKRKRENWSNEIKLGGYDVAENILFLEKFYLNVN